MINVLRFSRWRYLNPLCRLQQVKHFSLQDASTALRPFFFLVHPDFFGQHPSERIVNENSLKLLNEYLNSCQNKRNHPIAKEILFYMRKGDSFAHELKLVKIPLDSKTLRQTVLVILRMCDLSNSHVPKEPDYSVNRPIDWHPSYYAATGKKNPQAQRTPEKPVALSFRSWLKENIDHAREKAEAVKFIKDDIQRLLDKLKHDLCLRDIRCDSVWGLHNFRGCLKSFDRLCREQPVFVRDVLKDRTLVFSNGTGVSRSGEIILSGEDVPQYWYSLLMTIAAYDAVLYRLPQMEDKLSSLLNGIQIIRKRKQHGTVMAEDYELMLNRLINTLRRCQDHVRDKLQESDLSALQLVVDGEASPLTLSPGGHFLIPASIPGPLVVDFIDKHRQEALTLYQHTEQLLKEEEDQRQKASQVLNLLNLDKDEGVTLSQMISCCSRLVEQGWTFAGSLDECRLRVSHYHTVMQDGVICLPWDWVGTEDD